MDDFEYEEKFKEEHQEEIVEAYKKSIVSIDDVPEDFADEFVDENGYTDCSEKDTKGNSKRDEGDTLESED